MCLDNAFPYILIWHRAKQFNFQVVENSENNNHIEIRGSERGRHSSVNRKFNSIRLAIFVLLNAMEQIKCSCCFLEESLMKN